MAWSPEWIVEYAKCKGNPIGYGPWRLAYEAIATEVTHNVGSTTSSAKIALNGKPWNYTGPFELNDRIRIRTADLRPRDSTLLFDGVLTAWTPHFAGSASSGQEESSILAEDFRYLVDKMSVIYGQWAYRQDAYYGRNQSEWETQTEPIRDNSWHVDTLEALPVALNSITRLTGRRCVFNEDGRPNKSPTTCDYFPRGSTGQSYGLPVFGYLGAEYWSARDMIVYLLTIENQAMTLGLGPTANVSDAAGLDNADFDVAINHFIAERLTPLEAVEAITNFVGWQFRLDNYWDAWDAETQERDISKSRWVFYKPGTPTSRIRSESAPTVLHTLYAGDNYSQSYIDGFAPASESVTDALSRGENLVTSGNLLLDSRNVANISHALGGRKLYEATFELVPGWIDDPIQLYLDGIPLWLGEVDSDAFVSFPREPVHKKSVYITDNEITLISSDISNGYNYYNMFMPDGAWFNGDLTHSGYTSIPPAFINSYYTNNVGRKWVLNETGFYSKTTNSIPTTGSNYNRGEPYDFGDAVDGFDEKIQGYFPRSIKNTLSSLGPDGNTLKYKIQWSIDSGVTWIDFDHKILLLENEFGFYIAEPNLSEIKPLTQEPFFDAAFFDASDLGTEKNYFTVLCSQHVNGVSWGDWTLRMRIVCSVELDDRLVNITSNTNQSGSKYSQSVLLDLSNQYQYSTRTPSSIYYNHDEFPSDELDNTNALVANQSLIDKLNREARRTGNFSIPYIYWAEGASDEWRLPRFTIGDSIDGIAGRGISMATTGGGQGDEYNYVTIEQVRYLPEKAHTEIITADLRRSYL
ncbi:MAG: hypothetical protein GY841_04525 [FCB group bacterium]|nr:hypothetical protein [FCB group bacterium]